MNKNQAFIKALAVLMVKDQIMKGAMLGGPTGRIPWAVEWASVRQNTDIFGYPTVEEAEKVLAKQLGISMEGA